MAEFADTDVPVLTRGVIVRTFGEEALLTRTGTDVVHSLNPSAAFTVGLIDGTRTVAEICEEIAAAADTTGEAVHSDITELLATLADLGFAETN